MRNGIQQPGSGEPKWTDREMALFSGVPAEDLDSHMAANPSADRGRSFDATEDLIRGDESRRSRPTRRQAPEDVELEYDDEPGDEASDDSGEFEYVDDNAGDVDYRNPSRGTRGRDESWIDADVLDMAEGYGLSEQDLARLENRADFDRLLPMLDAQASNYFRQATQPGQQQLPSQPLTPSWPQSGAYQQQPAQPHQPAQQVQQPQQPVVEQVQDKPGWKDGAIDVEFFKKKYVDKGFDEDTVEALADNLSIIRETQLQNNQLREMLAKQDESIKTQQAYTLQQEQARQSEQFHDACDELDPKFYGQSLDRRGMNATLGQQEQNRRIRLAQAIEGFIIPEIIAKQQAQGMPPKIPSMRSLVKRANAVVFGQEQALRKQSAMRRPVGSASGRSAFRQVPKQRSNEPITHENQVDELMNNPQLLEAWQG